MGLFSSKKKKTTEQPGAYSATAVGQTAPAYPQVIQAQPPTGGYNPQIMQPTIPPAPYPTQGMPPQPLPAFVSQQVLSQPSFPYASQTSVPGMPPSRPPLSVYPQSMTSQLPSYNVQQQSLLQPSLPYQQQLQGSLSKISLPSCSLIGGTQKPSSATGLGAITHGWPGITDPSFTTPIENNKIAMLSGLDEQTVTALANEFQKLTRGTGRLDKAKFQSLFLACLYGPSAIMAERMSDNIFSVFDHNHSGTLDFAEYVSAYKAMLSGQQIQSMQT